MPMPSPAPSGLTRLAVLVGDWIARLAPEPLRSALRQDGLATLADVVRMARRRRGRTVAAFIMLAELRTLLALVLRARTSRTSGSGGGSRPRLPGQRKEGTMQTLIDDVRHAVRRLRAHPGHTTLATLMLALAIGTTCAMFTVVDALMLRPAPFPDPDQLVRVVVDSPEGTDASVSLDVYTELQRSPAFDRVTAAMRASVVLDDGPEPVQLSGAIVSPGFFEMAGVRPVLGRTFIEGDGRPGTSDRALLSEEVWREAFGRDPGILGRRVSLGGVSTEIVGIMPADFHLPSASARLWRPADPATPPQDWVHVGVPTLARLAAGMSRDDARRLATDAIRHAPDTPDEAIAVFRPVADGLLDEYSRNAVTVLAGGVALVFLVLCTNVTNLLLARATLSRRDYAVSSALGASRPRLIRQALFGSVMLGLAGIGIGLAAGWLLVSLARQYLPEAFLLRTLNPLDLDQRAVLVTAVVGLGAAVLAGVPPAWLGTSVSALESMRSGHSPRGGTATAVQRTMARGLLIGEVALAVTLLFGAALLVRSFVNLVGADRGLDSDRVVAVMTWLPRHHFETSASRRAFASTLEAELRGRPGVDDVALSYGMPPGGSIIYRGEVRELGAGGAGPVVFDGVVDGYPVAPAFFDVYGIRLLEGRSFHDGDPETHVVIGETLANLLSPGASAVGRTFTIGSRGPLTAIGVVNEVRRPERLDPRDDSPELYQPLFVATSEGISALWFSSGAVDIGLRCATACPPIAQIRQWVRQASPHAVISALHLLDDEYLRLMARPRAAAALALAFAVVGLLAAAGGIYSVLSYAVARRRREFGIRLALGAGPRQLKRLVYGDGLAVASLGLALGAVGAWGLSRSLAALTYETQPSSPALWLTVLATIAVATLVATWKPAREAARSDPAMLMQDE